MGGRAKRTRATRTTTSDRAALPSADPAPGVLGQLVTLYRQNRFGELLAEATKLQMRHSRSLPLYSLIAGAHVGLGNPGAAIACLDKALTLWPGSAELHYNKGVILRGTGAHDAAQRCYEEALRLDPSHAGAANNLGSVLKEKGDFAAAIRAYRKAVALQPDSAAAHNNLGTAHQHLGQGDQALHCFMTALRLSPDSGDIRRNLASLLVSHLPSGAVPGLPALLLDIVRRDDSARPSDLAPAICRLCHAEPGLGRVAAALEDGPDPVAALDALAGLPLLTGLMGLCPLPDPAIERLLTRLRAAVLVHLDELPARTVPALEALAAQCFVNDYIYQSTPDECRAAAGRAERVRARLARGDAPGMADLLCLATHAPLCRYDFAADLSSAALPGATWRMQIAEPAREAELRARIAGFGRIADHVSDKVRNQYEDNPYPRWIRPGFGQTGLSVSQMVAQLDLPLPAPAPGKATAPEILVAGCGTGQQPIEIARRFAGAQVTAIDLSRASLAYASRKTAELGMTNIEYLHGDILDLDALGRQFDLVISTGVLHHMADPEAGWRALCRRLRPHGLMKIALYSELARRDIVRLRQEIAESGASTEPEAMRAFRARLLRDPELRDSAFAHSSDFYSLSAFRDLLFHVQEHRFTIPMIGAALDRLGLAFCGFELSGQRILAAFRACHPDPGARVDLGLWHAFETEHPMTFAGMYQFWCQKL